MNEMNSEDKYILSELKNQGCDDGEAYRLLARLYEVGEQIEHDMMKALYLYEQASKLGNGKAAYQLGRIYEYSQYPDSAILAYKKAADLGVDLAIQWLKEASSSGNRQATEYLKKIDLR